MYEITETTSGYTVTMRDEHGALLTGPTFTDPNEADCALAILNDAACCTGTRRSMGAAWLEHCRRYGYSLKRLRSALLYMPRISVDATDWT